MIYITVYNHPQQPNQADIFKDNVIFSLTKDRCNKVSGDYQILAWEPPDDNYKAWLWTSSTHVGGEDDYKDCGTTQWYKNCGEDNSSCEFVARFDYCGMHSEIWD